MRTLTVPLTTDDLSDSWIYSDDDRAVVVTFVLIAPADDLPQTIEEWRDMVTLDYDSQHSFSTRLVQAVEVQP